MMPENKQALNLIWYRAGFIALTPKIIFMIRGRYGSNRG